MISSQQDEFQKRLLKALIITIHQWFKNKISKNIYLTFYNLYLKVYNGLNHFHPSLINSSPKPQSEAYMGQIHCEERIFILDLFFPCNLWVKGTLGSW